EQLRQQEQRRQQQIDEQLRQQEQRRQQQIDEQLRQQEQRRQQQIDEQLRQQEIEEQLRQQEQLRQEVVRNQREIPKSSAPVSVDKNPILPPGSGVSDTGGFLTANLSIQPEKTQQDLNSGRSPILKHPPRLKQKTKTPNKLPLLDEKDRQLVKQPVKCGVLLSIDANGNIFNPSENFKGIRATSDTPGMQDVCQRYAEAYFDQNRENIQLVPGRDIDNKNASGLLLIDITIQPLAPSQS
ncbi:MAG: hypothetical protein IGS39_13430, partial [Calothrix sp. C42_A2020_038]|nr:hypothetical protein [Calothrix sp. C42_A2020_038]